MKLNLLPKTVNTAGRARAAWLGSLVLALLGAAGMVAMILLSRDRLAKLKVEEATVRASAVQAQQTAALADTVAQQAQGVIRNAALAKAMNDHNAKYPEIYAKIFPYLPPFFRLGAISASPLNETTSRVQMTGYLDNYQQYADLMIALLRIPGVVTVGRAGFQDAVMEVPALTPGDQSGRPRLPGQAPIPDNDIQRLAYFQSQGRPSGYLNVGGYGGAPDTPRGAMPDSSQIAVEVVMPGDLRVPDVAATLRGGGGAVAPAGIPGGGGAFAPGIGGPGGAPPAAGGRRDDDEDER
jgi:hypothetical protein